MGHYDVFLFLCCFTYRAGTGRDKLRGDSKFDPVVRLAASKATRLHRLGKGNLGHRLYSLEGLVRGGMLAFDLNLVVPTCECVWR